MPIKRLKGDKAMQSRRIRPFDFLTSCFSFLFLHHAMHGSPLPAAAQGKIAIEAPPLVYPTYTPSAVCPPPIDCQRSYAAHSNTPIGHTATHAATCLSLPAPPRVVTSYTCAPSLSATILPLWPVSHALAQIPSLLSRSTRQACRTAPLLLPLLLLFFLLFWTPLSQCPLISVSSALRAP